MDKLLQCLKQATRIGADKDEPEGERYIQISETLVNEMIAECEVVNDILKSIGCKDSSE